jgi:hypothetical protein
VPGNCDVTGNGLCNGQDANAVRARRSGSPTRCGGQQAARTPTRTPRRAPTAAYGHGTTWQHRGRTERAGTGANAFFSATSGDTIEFGEGAFEFDTTLVAGGHTGLPKDGVTIRGQGPRKTILDFLGSNARGPLVLAHGRAHDREPDDASTRRASRSRCPTRTTS